MAPADEREGGRGPDLERVGDSDAQLLRGVAAQEPDAFAILHGRYVRAVYGLALRRLHDVDDAEAATRRAFAAMWRDATTDPPECGDAVRWLFTVARDAIGGNGRSEPDSGSMADDGWLAFCIHAAVAELPEQERMPLELAYWGGRRPKEIADLLGLPLSTVETRTRSALVRLATRLEEFS
jgi:RNA polymerase sigma-70 factor (ECF subfamily)